MLKTPICRLRKRRLRLLCSLALSLLAFGRQPYLRRGHHAAHADTPTENDELELLERSTQRSLRGAFQSSGRSRSSEQLEQTDSLDTKSSSGTISPEVQSHEKASEAPQRLTSETSPEDGLSPEDGFLETASTAIEAGKSNCSPSDLGDDEAGEAPACFRIYSGVNRTDSRNETFSSFSSFTQSSESQLSEHLTQQEYEKLMGSGFAASAAAKSLRAKMALPSETKFCDGFIPERLYRGFESILDGKGEILIKNRNGDAVDRSLLTLETAERNLHDQLQEQELIFVPNPRDTTKLKVSFNTNEDRKAKGEAVRKRMCQVEWALTAVEVVFRACVLLRWQVLEKLATLATGTKVGQIRNEDRRLSWKDEKWDPQTEGDMCEARFEIPGVKSFSKFLEEKREILLADNVNDAMDMQLSPKRIVRCFLCSDTSETLDPEKFGQSRWLFYRSNQVMGSSETEESRMQMCGTQDEALIADTQSLNDCQRQANDKEVNSWTAEDLSNQLYKVPLEWAENVNRKFFSTEKQSAPQVAKENNLLIDIRQRKSYIKSYRQLSDSDAYEAFHLEKSLAHRVKELLEIEGERLKIPQGTKQSESLRTLLHCLGEAADLITKGRDIINNIGSQEKAPVQLTGKLYSAIAADLASDAAADAVSFLLKLNEKDSETLDLLTIVRAFTKVLWSFRVLAFVIVFLKSQTNASTAFEEKVVQDLNRYLNTLLTFFCDKSDDRRCSGQIFLRSFFFETKDEAEKLQKMKSSFVESGKELEAVSLQWLLDARVEIVARVGGATQDEDDGGGRQNYNLPKVQLIKVLVEELNNACPLLFDLHGNADKDNQSPAAILPPGEGAQAGGVCAASAPRELAAQFELAISGAQSHEDTGQEVEVSELTKLEQDVAKIMIVERYYDAMNTLVEAQMCSTQFSDIELALLEEDQAANIRNLLFCDETEKSAGGSDFSVEADLDRFVKRQRVLAKAELSHLEKQLGTLRGVENEALTNRGTQLLNLARQQQSDLNSLYSETGEVIEGIAFHLVDVSDGEDDPVLPGDFWVHFPLHPSAALLEVRRFFADRKVAVAISAASSDRSGQHAFEPPAGGFVSGRDGRRNAAEGEMEARSTTGVAKAEVAMQHGEARDKGQPVGTNPSAISASADEPRLPFAVKAMKELAPAPALEKPTEVPQAHAGMEAPLAKEPPKKEAAPAEEPPKEEAAPAEEPPKEEAALPEEPPKGEVVPSEKRPKGDVATREAETPGGKKEVESGEATSGQGKIADAQAPELNGGERQGESRNPSGVTDDIHVARAPDGIRPAANAEDPTLAGGVSQEQPSTAGEQAGVVAQKVRDEPASETLGQSAKPDGPMITSFPDHSKVDGSGIRGMGESSASLGKGAAKSGALAGSGKPAAARLEGNQSSPGEKSGKDAENRNDGTDTETTPTRQDDPQEKGQPVAETTNASSGAARGGDALKQGVAPAKDPRPAETEGEAIAPAAEAGVTSNDAAREDWKSPAEKKDDATAPAPEGGPTSENIENGAPAEDQRFSETKEDGAPPAAAEDDAASTDGARDDKEKEPAEAKDATPAAAAVHEGDSLGQGATQEKGKPLAENQDAATTPAAQADTTSNDAARENGNPPDENKDDATAPAAQGDLATAQGAHAGTAAETVVGTEQSHIPQDLHRQEEGGLSKDTEDIGRVAPAEDKDSLKQTISVLERVGLWGILLGTVIALTVIGILVVCLLRLFCSSDSESGASISAPEDQLIANATAPGDEGGVAEKAADMKLAAEGPDGDALQPSPAQGESPTASPKKSQSDPENTAASTDGKKEDILSAAAPVVKAAKASDSAPQLSSVPQVRRSHREDQEQKRKEENTGKGHREKDH
ncbi:unnamed protein product [Amoebophrya sp. A25]|nr:unnamed protein product [Amoebophrya sp. A25]|eukprot:GSA25T00005026001.1